MSLSALERVEYRKIRYFFEYYDTEYVIIPTKYNFIIIAVSFVLKKVYVFVFIAQVA